MCPVGDSTSALNKKVKSGSNLPVVAFDAALDMDTLG
jgi:hypothetical protein